MSGRRMIHPTSGLQITVRDHERERWIALGDMKDAVPGWQWTPIMAMPSARRILARREFVATRIARRWADDLDTKQHKAVAAALHALIDWAESADLEVRRVAA